MGNLPTFYFSLFVAPDGIINMLESIRRRFLWGGCEEKRKVHWVAWENVIALKDMRGEGVRCGLNTGLKCFINY